MSKLNLMNIAGVDHKKCEMPIANCAMIAIELA